MQPFCIGGALRLHDGMLRLHDGMLRLHDGMLQKLWRAVAVGTSRSSSVSLRGIFSTELVLILSTPEG